MPANLEKSANIPELADHIESPVVLWVLRRLRQSGFILTGPNGDQEVSAIMQRLASLGLVDPGYDGPTNGKPFIWVGNHNGERVLRYLETSPHHKARLESKLKVSPLAETTLKTLEGWEELAVLAAAAALKPGDPASWPRERVERLGPDKPVYVLRVSPDLRAFIGVLDSGSIELLDIMREETLRRFLEHHRSGARAG